MMEAEHMTTKQSVQMEVLVGQFSVSCPFRPLDIFDVNFGTTLSLAGLAFTYVIVLMQFRIGDPMQWQANDFGNVTSVQVAP